MTRAETVVEDGAVFVRTGTERIEVGELERILDLVGGRAWTITYSEREKERHPELDTSDEGLTVDVVDTIEAMTFDRAFVETLAAQPAEPVTSGAGGADAGGDDVDGPRDDADAPPDDADASDDDPLDTVSPRLGLFVGRLLENLEYGVR